MNIAWVLQTGTNPKSKPKRRTHSAEYLSRGVWTMLAERRDWIASWDINPVSGKTHPAWCTGKSPVFLQCKVRQEEPKKTRCQDLKDYSGVAAGAVLNLAVPLFGMWNSKRLLSVQGNQENGLFLSQMNESPKTNEALQPPAGRMSQTYSRSWVDISKSELQCGAVGTQCSRCPVDVIRFQTFNLTVIPWNYFRIDTFVATRWHSLLITTSFRVSTSRNCWTETYQNRKVLKNPTKEPELK